ncbi:DUF523 and DUF1722 domain-containing protein [Citrobacter cronae]|nr:DUF523 and DUF1722 domain-containing protein [Citrobacter cronae]
MSEKIPVGISACLLGEAVRYDGGHKRLAFAVEDLSPWVAFEPVCPEMGIGLPVPRPALHLVKEGEAVSLRFSDKREGYFRTQLNSRQRQELPSLIDGYRRATQPLLAPITLLKHYMAEYPDAYLSGQRYFNPWPEALRLRYGR